MNLAPEILKMRDALLERINGKSLSEVAEIVNEILLNETNNINRLAALSARVQILRDFNKKEFDLNKNTNLLNKNIEQENIKENPVSKAEIEKKSLEVNESSDDWIRVEMLKSGIVNGVRFPEGVVIDVSKADADKLTEEGLVKIKESSDIEKETTEENSKDAQANLNSKKEIVDKNNKTKDESIKNDELTQIKNIETNAKDEVKQDLKEEKTETPAKEDSKEEIVAVSAKDEVKQDPKEEKTETPSKKKSNEQGQDNLPEKKILKKKSTKITEETIELTDPKAVAEALGLNEKKKKEEEPEEIEEEVDLESLETGK